MENLLKTIQENRLNGELDFILDNHIIFENGNLGIPVKMLKDLYKDAVIEFNRTRSFTVDNDSMKRENSFALNVDCSLVLTLINPENYTALNYRKRLLLNNAELVSKEVELIQFALTKHPSKPCLFYHLYFIYREFNLNMTRFNELMDQMCCRYKCNYSSWRYKRTLLIGLDFGKEMIKNTDFVQSHLSDCSGWSFRQYLVDFWFLNNHDTDARQDMKDKELRFVEGLTQFYGETELLGIHLKYVKQLIV